MSPACHRHPHEQKQFPWSMADYFLKEATKRDSLQSLCRKEL
jgi:hypothetical protein